MNPSREEHWTAETLMAALIPVRWIPAAAVSVPLALVRYLSHQSIQWAAALAYYTLIGLVPLLAVFGILGTAEMCFNTIWGGVPGRSLRHKLRSYSKVAVVAPLLLIFALALTALLQPGSHLHQFLDSWYLGGAVLVLL